MASFTPNMPTASQSLGETQQKVQDNFTVINTAFGIDHATFNDVNEGYHTKIHSVSQGTWNPVTRVATPAVTPTAGFQQIFPLLYTPDSTAGVQDTQLFSMTGLGGVSQLSGISAATEGWCWAGGLLFQWGTVNFTGSTDHQTNSIVFKGRNTTTTTIPFPTSCFMINATLKVASSGTLTASNTIAIRSLSNTGFTWVYNSSSSSGTALFPGFYWLAVGI